MEGSLCLDLVVTRCLTGLFFSLKGEGVVPESPDQAQAAEAGRGVARVAAEEKRKPACEPLESSHSAGQPRGHRRHLRGLTSPTDDSMCDTSPAAVGSRTVG